MTATTANGLTGGADPQRTDDAAKRPSESRAVMGVKLLMALAALLFMLRPLTTTAGLVAAATAIVAAFVVARWAYTRGMRQPAAVVGGVAFSGLAWLLSNLVRDAGWLAGLLGVEGAIIASDVLLFGGALFGVLFTIRFLAQSGRLFTVIEALLIVFSVVYTFSDHRHLRLNQPRFFSDWALSNGIDPTVVLMGMGVTIMLLALVMFMRRQGGLKAILSMLFAIIVGVGVYLYIDDDKVQPAVLTNGLGLTSDEQSDNKDSQSNNDGQSDQNNDGPSGGNGGGDGDSPYKQNYDNSDKPKPVAVVAFHDDYEAPEGILYFRQQVKSKFNETHLAADGTYDHDVIDVFPQAASGSGPVAAAPSQNLDFHKKVPTSVYLIAQHPQPVALTHATELKPLDNPNSRVFTAAYGVTSHVLAGDMRRLLGRPSVPDEWTDEQRAHYLAVPDDPRYEALSDILVRDLDPRFRDDQLMKALVIKRYLEKEGYYTRTETHTDESDPTASFLFGSLRGYCVHFAHSAAFLFRSQGIASRVAVGYAVDTRKRSGGSNLLIYGSAAHAWPEIHIAGVGWVTFDIYPEQSDEPPTQVVDQDLESLLGEMAREDPTGGRADDPNKSPFPWLTILWSIIGLLGLLLLTSYGIKIWRRLKPRFGSDSGSHVWTLRAALDRLADVGITREHGETRERFAARVAETTPSLAALTSANLSGALGRGTDPRETSRIYDAVSSEFRDNVHWFRRLLGNLNPIGWAFTR